MTIEEFMGNYDPYRDPAMGTFLDKGIGGLVLSST